MDALKGSHQRMVDDAGKPLRVSDGPLVDTVFPLAFFIPSAEDQSFWSEALELPDDFVTDVQAVDFTTAVFSDQRCGLLKFAPEGSATMPLEKIRAGFVERLKAANPSPGSPEAQLLANFTNPDDEDALNAKGRAFLDACKRRPPAEFMADVLKIVSLQRSIARKLPIFEHAELMPIDDLAVPPGTRLDPSDCLIHPK